MDGNLVLDGTGPSTARRPYVRNANFAKFEERYLDCPWCGGLISDAENVYNDVIEVGNTFKCPLCGKPIRITGEF